MRERVNRRLELATRPTGQQRSHPQGGLSIGPAAGAADVATKRGRHCSTRAGRAPAPWVCAVGCTAPTSPGGIHCPAHAHELRPWTRPGDRPKKLQRKPPSPALEPTPAVTCAEPGCSSVPRSGDRCSVHRRRICGSCAAPISTGAGRASAGAARTLSAMVGRPGMSPCPDGLRLARRELELALEALPSSAVRPGDGGRCGA